MSGRTRILAGLTVSVLLAPLHPQAPGRTDVPEPPPLNPVEGSGARVEFAVALAVGIQWWRRKLLCLERTRELCDQVALSRFSVHHGLRVVGYALIAGLLRALTGARPADVARALHPRSVTNGASQTVLAGCPQRKDFMRSRRTVQCLCAVLALAAATAVRAQDQLGVEDAVRVALERNPEIGSLAAEVAAARARLQGATLLSQRNPEVTFGAGARRTGVRRSADFEVDVSQQIEVFGERAARITGARAALASTEARYRARKVELAAQVREAFARAFAAERLLGVAREARELAVTVGAAATRRLEVGAASQIELNSARVEVGRAASELAEALRRRETALAELRLLIAVDPGTDLGLAGELSPLGGPGAEPGSLLAIAREQRADLRAAREDLAAAGAERRLAEREALPKPRVGARFAREGEEEVAVGTLSFDLPVLNRNQAGRGVAAARVVQATGAIEAAERRVSQEVRLAIARLEAAREAARAFDREVVLAMEENLRLVTTAYQAGKIGVVELLVLRRDTLEARRGRIRAQEELVSAEAQLFRALGQEGPTR